MRSLTGTLNLNTATYARKGHGLAVDLCGIALFAFACAWMLDTRVRSGGSAAPGIGLAAGCGLVVIVARTLGSRARLLVPAAVLLAAISVIAWLGSSVLSSKPLAGPLGYQNANGAFYAQAAIAGLMLAASGLPRAIRMIGGTAAVLFVVLPLMVHAVAAATLVLALPAIVGVAGLFGAGAARISIAIMAGLLLAAVAATILLGSTFSPNASAGMAQRAAVATVDRERLALWHDAFVIMRDHPLTGVGPSRYQVISPIASHDRDHRWAHNEFLQQGAEGGFPGLILMVALFGWGFARLWIARAPDAITGLAAASLATLGIHTSIDYVIHFSAIPLMCAALVATGMIENPTGRLGLGGTRDDGAK